MHRPLSCHRRLSNPIRLCWKVPWHDMGVGGGKGDYENWTSDKKTGEEGRASCSSWCPERSTLIVKTSQKSSRLTNWSSIASWWKKVNFELISKIIRYIDADNCDHNGQRIIYSDILNVGEFSSTPLEELITMRLCPAFLVPQVRRQVINLCSPGIKVESVLRYPNPWYSSIIGA